MRSLWDVIDEIREKPEDTRRRYMFAYVSVTMLVVIGIWLVTVQESLHSVATVRSVENLKDQAGQALPGLGMRSLSELLEKGERLDLGGGAPAPAEDFFESEMRAKDGKDTTEEMKAAEAEK